MLEAVRRVTDVKGVIISFRENKKLEKLVSQNEIFPAQWNCLEANSST